MFPGLARLTGRHPWRVLAVALVYAAVAAVVGGPVAGLLKGGGFNDPGAESSQGAQRIRDAAGIDPQYGFVVLIRGDDAGQLPQLSRHLRAALTGGGLVPDPVRVYRDPFASAEPSRPDPTLLASDGQSFLARLDTGSLNDTKAITDRVQQAINADVLLSRHATLGGPTAATAQINGQVSSDLAKAEALAFPILFVVLFFVFRPTGLVRHWRRTRSMRAVLRAAGDGVVAALLPIVVGALAIVSSLLGLRAVAAATTVNIFALNVCTGLGLGLSIDYSLLILSRYREEMGRHGAGAVALHRTLASAGRTVVFSALTVSAAMASLMLFPFNFLWSMGVGGILVAMSAALITLLVLPALLIAFGRRLAPVQLTTEEVARHGGWYRFSHFVMRRPVVIALTTGTVLIVAGLPFLHIKFTSVDISVLSPDHAARQVDIAARRDFPAYRVNTAQVVVDAPSVETVQQYAGRLGAQNGVAGVPKVVSLAGGRWEVDVALGATDALSDGAQNTVAALRDVPAPGPRFVTGFTAYFADLQSSLGAHLPLGIALVVLITLLVLFAMTGSVVLPVKAVLMNGLTLSAALGLLVFIFQDGRFEDLLRYTSSGALSNTNVIVLVAISFGLSTDYGVFLLGRIKEGHDRGLGTRPAVALGLERTGRIVTAAALCFCVAVGTFATSEIVFIKQLGVGTALAVAIDASIVRAFLVPALMAILGEWNWWAPRPLRALHHRLRLDRLEDEDAVAA